MRHPAGSYRTRAFDWRTDTRVHEPLQDASVDAVLLFDGIFAQRPELEGVWDYCIFLRVDFDEALQRSLVRDSRPGLSEADLERRFWARYAAGQRLYLSSVRPGERADITIDNNDPERPYIVR